MDWLTKFNDLRKKSGLSLDELSAKAGIPKSTLSKISAGITQSPSIDTIYDLVHAMGYTLDDIDPNPPKKSPPLQDGDAELLENYHALDPTDRGRVLERIDSLLEADKYKEDAVKDA